MTKDMITDLCRDSITVAGQVVKRPAGISPSQWYQAWEKIVGPVGKRY